MTPRAWPLITILALASCPSSPKLGFLEGPPRLECKPEKMMAQVGVAWRWSCIVAGDISRYKEEPLGIEIVTFKREEFPQRSLSNGGLKRVYNYATTFDAEYYFDLMGKHRFQPGERPEAVIEMPPIEGYDAYYDGSFWIEVRIFPIEYWNPATHEVAVGKMLTSDKLRGRLSCPTCAA